MVLYLQVLWFDLHHLNLDDKKYSQVSQAIIVLVVKPPTRSHLHWREFLNLKRGFECSVPLAIKGIYSDVSLPKNRGQCSKIIQNDNLNRTDYWLIKHDVFNHRISGYPFLKRT